MDKKILPRRWPGLETLDLCGWHSRCSLASRKPTSVKRSVNRGDRSLAEEVLSYLSEHPEAQDTVEGIAQWWLAEERIRHSVDEVTAVLSELVARKLVIARQGKDGRFHYRLNPNREGNQQMSKSK